MHPTTLVPTVAQNEWIENLHCKCVRSVFWRNILTSTISMPLIQGLAHLRTWSLRPCMVPRAYEHGEGITHATTWSSWSSWSSNTYNIIESHWNWQNVIEWHLKITSLIAGHCWGRLNCVALDVDQIGSNGTWRPFSRMQWPSCNLWRCSYVILCHCIQKCL